MKLKDKLVLIVIVIAIFINCGFWFACKNEAMLLVHLLITLSLTGFGGWFLDRAT
jgi:hypothetical protein